MTLLVNRFLLVFLVFDFYCGKDSMISATRIPRRFLTAPTTISPCLTKRCQSRSDTMYAWLDPSADRCETPNLFFCGKYLNNTVNPYLGTSRGSFPSTDSVTAAQIRALLKNKECVKEGGPDIHTYDNMLSCYYSACMDTGHAERGDGLKWLIPTIQSSFRPLYHRAHSPENANSVPNPRVFAGHLAKLYATLTVPGLFQLRVDAMSDPTDPQSLYLYRDESSPPSRSDTLNQEKFDTHVDYISALLGNFTVDLKGTTNPTDLHRISDGAKSRSIAVVTFEERLNDLSARYGNTHEKSKQELKDAFQDVIDMDVYLDLVSVYYGISELTRGSRSRNAIRVSDMVMHHLPLLIKDTATGTLLDYLLVQTLKHYRNGLPRRYREAHRASADGNSREELCEKLITEKKHLAWVFSLRYVRSIDNFEARKRISEDMAKELVQEFRTTINALTWMDAGTKEKAIEKLDGLQGTIGYPDWLLTDPETHFEKYYGKPKIQAMRNMASAHAHVSRYEIRYRLSQLSHPKEQTGFPVFSHATHPFVPAAAYHYYRNQFVVPLAVMQAPLLHLWNDCSAGNSSTACSPPEEIAFMKVLTFAGMGYLIAHEIMHAFDNYGRTRGPTGAWKNWWSADSAKAFFRNSQCMRNQYDGYGLKLYKAINDTAWEFEIVRSRSPYRSEEIVADNGGLKLAYSTLKRLHPEYFTSQIVAHRQLKDAGFNSTLLFTASFAQHYCVVSRESDLREHMKNKNQPVYPLRIIGALANFAPHSASCQNSPATDPLTSSNSYPSTHPYLAAGPYPATGDLATIVFNHVDRIVAPKRARCELW